MKTAGDLGLSPDNGRHQFLEPAGRGLLIAVAKDQDLGSPAHQLHRGQQVLILLAAAPGRTGEHVPGPGKIWQERPNDGRGRVRRVPGGKHHLVIGVILAEQPLQARRQARRRAGHRHQHRDLRPGSGNLAHLHPAPGRKGRPPTKIKTARASSTKAMAATWKTSIKSSLRQKGCGSRRAGGNHAGGPEADNQGI